MVFHGALSATTFDPWAPRFCEICWDMGGATASPPPRGQCKMAQMEFSLPSSKAMDVIYKVIQKLSFKSVVKYMYLSQFGVQQHSCSYRTNVCYGLSVKDSKWPPTIIDWTVAGYNPRNQICLTITAVILHKTPHPQHWPPDCGQCQPAGAQR